MANELYLTMEAAVKKVRADGYNGALYAEMSSGEFFIYPADRFGKPCGPHLHSVKIVDNST